MRPRVAFIGLGLMGRPMAANLLSAGFELCVSNRSRGAVDALVAAGARAADTPAVAAATADVIVTMLPDSAAVEEVVAGPAGILEGAAPAALIVDMSTISPAVVRALAAEARRRGARMLDAPVSGGDVGAEQGTLSIMVGGEAGDVARARPVLEAVGSTVTHVGEIGAGQVVKACNQVLVALVIQANAEALVLAAKAGVDPALAHAALSQGFGANRVLDVRGRSLLEHDFRPGARVDLHHKDLEIARTIARQCGAVLPGTALVEQLLESLRADGRGHEDHSALLTVVEQLSAQSIARRAAAPSLGHPPERG